MCSALWSLPRLEEVSDFCKAVHCTRWFLLQDCHVWVRGMNNRSEGPSGSKKRASYQKTLTCLLWGMQAEDKSKFREMPFLKNNIICWQKKKRRWASSSSLGRDKYIHKYIYMYITSWHICSAFSRNGEQVGTELCVLETAGHPSKL